MLTIVGAGMAGLAASVRARELNEGVVVLERGDGGGSMLLSSCVVWRYRDLDTFREQCPGGDERLQAAVIEQLDEALQWLVAHGAEPLTRDTGNPLTVGMRFDPAGLRDALVRAAGPVLLREPPGQVPGPYVLCTGGFQGSAELVAEHIRPRGNLILRANRFSQGDGLRLGLARGAALSDGMDEFYGRAMPAVPPALVTEEGFVPLAQLYAKHAVILDETGAEIPLDPDDWSETRLVQEIARRPNARAWFVVDANGLRQKVRERTVADMVDAAEGAGGTVHRGDTFAHLNLAFGLDLPDSPRLMEPPFVAVHVQASITHTIGGLRIDDRARVLDGDGAPVGGLYAAGADAGGTSTGGYASGLAAALVFGRIAVETAVAELG
jgi:succinate dehydrogenase/fumarate reductase flavoprotein subunit